MIPVTIRRASQRAAFDLLPDQSLPVLQLEGNC